MLGFMKCFAALSLVACFLLAPLQGQEKPAPAPASPSDRLKIVSWNVLYGFNHGRSIEEGAQWIREQHADVLALQELNGFTAESLQGTADSFGHPHSALQKEQGFAMGLTSTAPIEVLERRVEGFHHGYLHCKTHGIEFFVVHFWPGKEHELESVLAKVKSRIDAGAQVAILGDFNSHSQKDSAYLASKSFEPRFDAIRSVETAGLVDVVHRFDRGSLYSCPSPITIPKWSTDIADVESKRQRIDFIFLDKQLARRSRSATILQSKDLEAISDHYPVVAELARLPHKRAVDAKRFAFGVVADCQYCAAPARGVRQYADSRWKLEACVDHLETLAPSYVVHLGDFIDRGFESFDVVAPIYDALTCDKYHVLGNHDYSVADELKASVPQKLGLPSNYYEFAVDDWRFVVLDGNDISLYAHIEGSAEHTAALDFHSKHVPNAPVWNGALGSKQLEWLESVLRRAEAASEKVILYCHFPVFPEANHNLWNANELLDLIEPYSCVKAYMNGHNHAGNYAIRDGIHFLTLKGMVDTRHTSYAVVEVYGEHLSVMGFGREIERSLRVR
ncbi:MAG: manganese-dependent ADP-ribose/CDP-alcohol diphosphatase [Planctomycetota bacterium]|jgi:manganese-dependent ADP-ribose/CDP-alcohol diphosphatase